MTEEKEKLEMAKNMNEEEMTLSQEEMNDIQNTDVQERNQGILGVNTANLNDEEKLSQEEMNDIMTTDRGKT